MWGKQAWQQGQEVAPQPEQHAHHPLVHCRRSLREACLFSGRGLLGAEFLHYKVDMQVSDTLAAAEGSR